MQDVESFSPWSINRIEQVRLIRIEINWCRQLALTEMEWKNTVHTSVASRVLSFIQMCICGKWIDGENCDWLLTKEMLICCWQKFGGRITEWKIRHVNVRMHYECSVRHKLDLEWHAVSHEFRWENCRWTDVVFDTFRFEFYSVSTMAESKINHFAFE